LNHSYRYSAEPATITEIVVLKWFTSTLSNQEPLKINSASSIPMIPLKRILVGGFLFEQLMFRSIVYIVMMYINKKIEPNLIQYEKRI